MQIVITFDSLEEFDAFRGGTPVEPVIVPVTQIQQDNEQIKEMLKDPVAAVEKLIDQPAPAPEKPKVDKPAVRKILADLNKQEGTNKAAELIKAAGYDKLSEVPDEALAGIVEQAEQLLGRA